MADRVRVQKAIAHAGLMSRRAAEEAIANGRVTIDGRQAVLGDRVDLDAEDVQLDGIHLPVNPKKRTYLLYKPVGVISTADDPQGRDTVVDLIASGDRLYPVGRLDADSEGLILLTNDGELANLVTHPRYQITKKYMVLLKGRPRQESVRMLITGVELDDGVARALDAREIDHSDGNTLVEMVMAEGRNREIRRMWESIGFEVISLVRTAIGPITDGNLKPGQSRLLQPDELMRLTSSAKS